MTAIPSQEVIARFNEGFECWNRGDLDEMMDDYHPDAEFDWSAATVDEAPGAVGSRSGTITITSSSSGPGCGWTRSK